MMFLRLPAFAAAVGIAVSFFAPSDFVSTISGEIINFFGFVIAAVVPAMALSAAALRGNSMSIKRINQLHAALKRQMHFWASLVVLGFIGVIFVLILKPLVDCGKLQPCVPKLLFENQYFSIDSRIFTFLVGYIFGLMAGNMGNIVIGLMSLLDVNAEAARGEAKQKFDEDSYAIEKSILKINNPDDYGRLVDLPETEDKTDFL